jgi:hypothetical protein
VTTVAEQKISEAISLRAQLDTVRAELRALRPPRKPRVIVTGNELIHRVIYMKMEGPLMENGFFTTRRCPTCGHRI